MMPTEASTTQNSKASTQYDKQNTNLKIKHTFFPRAQIFYRKTMKTPSRICSSIDQFKSSSIDFRDCPQSTSLLTVRTVVQ